jgi:acetylornithine/succinyldiaminopimelate/putrescine aminotransferase
VQQAAAKKRNQDLADIVAKTDEEITEHTGTDAEEITEEVVQRQGYVWRGVIKVEELNDEVSQKVVAIIQKLGGKKAGQVELGWKKGDSRYFHFTIPESHYTEFNQSLQDIGQIQLKKEKHPRVMPQGSMRIIMSLESGAP